MICTLFRYSSGIFFMTWPYASIFDQCLLRISNASLIFPKLVSVTGVTFEVPFVTAVYDARQDNISFGFQLPFLGYQLQRFFICHFSQQMTPIPLVAISEIINNVNINNNNNIKVKFSLISIHDLLYHTSLKLTNEFMPVTSTLSLTANNRQCYLSVLGYRTTPFKIVQTHNLQTLLICYKLFHKNNDFNCKFPWKQ